MTPATSPPSAVELAVSVGAATLALLAYQVAPAPLAVIASALFVVVAYRTPTAGLVAAILALPYYLEPRPVVGAWAFSAAEVGIVLTSLAAAPRLLVRVVGEARRTSSLGDRARAAWQGSGWIAVGALLLVLLGLLSLLVSIRLAESLRSLRTIVIEPAALLLVALYAPDGRSARAGRERAYWLASALVLSAAATSALGLWQIPTGQRLVPAEDGLIRIRGLYGSPNHLALFLGRALPLAACLFAFGFGKWRWAAGVAALLIAAAVLLTFSIGALIALPVAFLLVAALRGRRPLVAYVGAGLLLALGSLPILLSVERFASHLSPTGGTNIFRLAVWSGALAMIRDHPILGIGLDNFLYYYRDLKYMPEYGGWEPNLSHPHNLAFDFWLSLGLLGLLLALALLARFFASAIALYREATLKGAMLKGGWTAAVVLGLIGSMADSVLHGLVDNSYFLPDLAAVFWVSFATLGLLLTRSAGPYSAVGRDASRDLIQEAAS